MIDFKMPALGADREKGTVVTWHVQPGSNVQKGDVILDVETDKGTIAVDVWETGQISEILVQPGATVPVGTPLARIADKITIVGMAPKPSSVVNEPDLLQPSPTRKIPPEVKRRRISPLARRMAKDLNIDLNRIADHEDGSPICREDVEAVASQQTSKARVDKPATQPLSRAPEQSSPDQFARLRSVISELMARSKREIPHYYLETEINLTSTLEWLDQLNSSRSISNRILPVALLLKAVAQAASKAKGINGHFIDGTFHESKDVHLGIILSLRQGGIVSPAIRHADQLSIDDIMMQLMDLIQRARHGKLKSSEVTDQTLTVTSLGDTGVDRVLGIIYPPQVAIIGFGRITWRPWADKHMIGAAQTVVTSLSADHRVSDGLSGAAFLSEVSQLLRQPASL